MPQPQDRTEDVPAVPAIPTANRPPGRPERDPEEGHLAPGERARRERAAETMTTSLAAGSTASTKDRRSGVEAVVPDEEVTASVIPCTGAESTDGDL